MSIRAKEIITQSILPQHTNVYDIGSTSLRWNNIVAKRIHADNWIYSTGATGWYNETYGGGIYMNDSTWIKTYASKSFYSGNGAIRSDSMLQVGPDGNKFYANSSGNAYISNTLGIGGTNTGYKFYVNGGNAYISGTITTNSYFITPNNQGLRVKNTSGTPTEIIFLNTSNQTVLPNADVKIERNLTVSKTISASSTASTWISGQKDPVAAINVANSTSSISYYPWIRQTLASGHVCSIGTLDSSIYAIGSIASKTDNGYDHGIQFDVKSGSLTLDRTALIFKTANFSSIPMSVLDDGTSYGHTLVIGAGGTTYIGAGESAMNIYNATGVKSAEKLYLCADEDITFYSNCQDPAQRKAMTYNAKGELYVNNRTFAGSLFLHNKGTWTAYAVGGNINNYGGEEGRVVFILQ